MKSRNLIIIFGAVFLALCAGAFFLYRAQPSGSIANIYQDGVCIKSIDLAAITSTQTFTITDGDGHENVVEAEQGRIRIASANCPDQVCVDTGWVSSSLQPIVCLPAKLVIQIESDPVAEELGLDAVSG